jgi:hypothetical protein
MINRLNVYVVLCIDRDQYKSDEGYLRSGFAYFSIGVGHVMCFMSNNEIKQFSFHFIGEAEPMAIIFVLLEIELARHLPNFSVHSFKKRQNRINSSISCYTQKRQ